MTRFNGAKVNFTEPVGTISVQVRWATNLSFFNATVVQATGEIIAGYVYSHVGLYEVTVKASTDEGDTATKKINVLVN